MSQLEESGSRPQALKQSLAVPNVGRFGNIGNTSTAPDLP
jgi:hypothetical protein